MKKPRNKKYNPNKHAINPNCAFDAINLVKPVSNDAKSKLSTGINVALDAFAKGYAQKCHFDTLAATVDLAGMLSLNLFENAYSEEIIIARNGMMRCKERFIRTGKLGFDGEALGAVKFAIQLHDEQLNQVTGAEVLAFLKQRDNHIRSGNFYKGEGIAA